MNFSEFGNILLNSVYIQLFLLQNKKNPSQLTRPQTTIALQNEELKHSVICFKGDFYRHELLFEVM